PRRRVVRVVRGELRARAGALPRLRRERDGVPDASGPGPAGHGRLDADVSESGLRRLSGSEPLSPMTSLRTAIVGSGFVARVHASAVRDLGGTVVAVCSRTRASAGARGLGEGWDRLRLARSELRVVHGRYVCDAALLVSGGWRL